MIAIGLDIGQSSTKLVVLQRRANAIRVRRTAAFRNRDEGILNEDDLAEHLGPWLKEQGCADRSLVLAIPQFLTTAQIADFPTGVEHQLGDMVAYETQHLAGLSDEAILHDYARMQPFHIYRNPVLIGICRESVIDNVIAPARHNALHVCDLTMGGVALANAFIHTAADRKPPPNSLELLLDIGAESTTYTILLDRQVLHAGSFLIGGTHFTRAIARQLECTPESAEARQAAVDLIAPDSPGLLTRAAEEFAAELLQSIEHWRHQNEQNTQPMAAIHCSGGASRLPGLQPFLADRFQCTTHTIAIDEAPEDTAHQFAIAYGLALQGMGSRIAPLPISLAPPQLKWTNTRRRRLPYAQAAAALFAILVAALFAATATGMQRRNAELAVEARRLQRCADLIPDAESVRNQAIHLENMLVPFVAYGNRNQAFVDAVAVLSRHRQEGDWLVYLADEISYTEGTAIYAPSEEAPEETTTRSLFALPAKEPPPQHHDATAIRPWRYLVVAGFTPWREDNPLANIRATVDALNNRDDSIFTDVDTLPDPQVRQQVYRCLTPWLKLFKNFRLRPFVLKLPLRRVDYEGREP